MANRWGISKDVEELVKKRDLQCVYCGKEFTDTGVLLKTRRTWEHIINDISINGADNIALCCSSCNASKGAKRLDEWLNSKYCTERGITIDKVASVVQSILNK